MRNTLLRTSAGLAARAQRLIAARAARPMSTRGAPTRGVMRGSALASTTMSKTTEGAVVARHSPRGPVAPSPVALATRSFSTSIIARQEQASTAEEEQQRELDDGEKNIVEILTREFQPAQLQVQDVSGGCGSFYAIIIASHKFKGLPTVKAHRLVNESLKVVIAGIHGLQLRTMPADE